MEDKTSTAQCALCGWKFDSFKDLIEGPKEAGEKLMEHWRTEHNNENRPTVGQLGVDYADPASGD